MIQPERRKEARSSFTQAQMNDAINDDLDGFYTALEKFSGEMRDGFNKVYWALLGAGLAFASSVAAYVVSSALQN